MATSTFILLPAEVRVKIYQYLFSGSSVKVSASTSRSDHRFHHSILSSCHQIYAEAQPLLASSLKVEFGLFDAHVPYFDHLHPKIRSDYLIHVKHAQLLFDPAKKLDFDALPSLEQLSLRTETLKCHDLSHNMGMERNSYTEWVQWLDGKHDNTLVRDAKRLLYFQSDDSTDEATWLTEVISNPARSFKVVASFRMCGTSPGKHGIEEWQGSLVSLS